MDRRLSHKRIFSFLLAMLMLLPVFGQTAHAIDNNHVVEDFVISDGVLKSYVGAGGEITIPDGVTSIDSYVFSDKKITKVIFNDDLVDIGEYAFSDNAIEELDLKHVKHVGESAFKNNKLRSLNLGDSILSIENHAFVNNDLITVNLPDTIINLGKGAFSGNNRYVELTGKTDSFTSDFTPGSFGYVINPVCVVVSFVDEESGQKIIDDKVVGGDLTVEGGVFSIGDETIYKAPQLSGYQALTDEIIINPSKSGEIFEIKYKNMAKKPVIHVDGNRFDEGDVIDEKALLANVTAYDLNNNNISDKVQVTPNHIDSVPGQYAVTYRVEDDYGNIAIKEAVILVNVDYDNIDIGNGWKIGDFKFEKNKVMGFSDSGLEKVKTNKNLVIPDSYDNSLGKVDTIAADAFKNYGLVNISCQSGIKCIEAGAFARNFIEELDLPYIENLIRGNWISQEDTFGKNLKKVNMPALQTISGYYTFQGCNNLTNVSMPALQTISGNYTFRDCNNLTDVSMPALQTISGNYTFNRCNNLINVSMPALQTISGSNTFRSCDNLTDVSMPALQTISGGSTFNRCNNLINVSMPALQTISGSDTFYNCYKLNKVLSFPSLVIIHHISFSGDGDRFTVYGKKGEPMGVFGDFIFNPVEINDLSGEYFDDDFIWEGNDKIIGFTKNGFSKLKNNNGVLILPEKAKALSIRLFYNNDILTEFHGKGIEKLNAPSIFQNCKNLKKVNMPALQTISGYSTFQGCNNLTNVSMPVLQTILGGSTFRYCNNLTDVSIPALQIISGYYTFQGCNNLTDVSIPALQTISGSDTFYGCSKLNKVVISDDFSEVRSKRTLEDIIGFASGQKITIYTKNRTNPNNIATNTANYILNPTKLVVHFKDSDGKTLADDFNVEKVSFPHQLQDVPYMSGFYTNFKGEIKESDVQYVDNTKAVAEYTIVYKKYTDEELKKIEDNSKNMSFNFKARSDKPYYIGSPMASDVSFDFTNFAENLSEGSTIEIYPNSDVFDMDKTEWQIDNILSVKSVKKDKNKVIITLNELRTGSSMSFPLIWYFKKYVTAENTPFSVSAILKDPNGNVVGKTKDAIFKGYYNKSMYRKYSNSDSYHRFELENLTEDGGALESQLVTYSFGIDRNGYPLERNIGKFKIVDTLPTYVKTDGSKGIALFKQEDNPLWKLSDDGFSVIYEGNANNSINLNIPKLNLRFPDAKLNENIKNKVDFELTPFNKGRKEVSLTGFAEDYFYFMKKYIPTGHLSKRIFEPRYDDNKDEYYFYDVSLDKEKEFNWIIYVKAFEKNLGKMQARLKDYNLDARMSYKAFILPKSFVGGSIYLYDNNDKILSTLPIEKEGRIEVPVNIQNNIKYVTFESPKDYFESYRIGVVTELNDKEIMHYNKTEPSKNAFKNSVEGTFIFDHSSVKGSYTDQVLIKELKQCVGAYSKTSYPRPNEKIVFPDTKGYYDVGGFKKSDLLLDDLENVKLIDVLPKGVSVTSIELTDMFKSNPTGRYEVIDDYKDSGRTAVIFTSDKIFSDSLDANGYLNFARINTITDLDIPQGIGENEVYFDFSNKNVDKYLTKTMEKYNGNKTYNYAFANNIFQVEKAKELYTLKYIKTESMKNWSKTGVVTESLEKFSYKLSLINNTDSPRKNTVFIDVFPFENDKGIVGKDRKLRGSEFHNTFDYKTGIKVPDGYDVYYLNSPVPDYTDDIDAVETSWNWVKTPSKDTKAFKIVANNGVALAPNSILDIIVPMIAADNRDYSLSGKKAYNTFARKDDITGRFLESNRVYNEMKTPIGNITLTKMGTDFIKNVPLSGVKFTIKDDKGNYIATKTTNDQGYLSFDGLGVDKDYIITEVETAKGYKLDDTPIVVKGSAIFNAENRVYDLGIIQNSKKWFPIEPLEGAITLRKVNASGKALSGVKFELKGMSDANKDVLLTRISSSVGLVDFSNLIPGKYLLTELSSAGSLDVIKPMEVIVKGSLAGRPSHFIVNGVEYQNDLNAPNFKVVNNKARLNILKLGVLEDKMNKPLTELQAFDGVKLAGVTFDLYKGTTLIESDIKTDGDGEAFVNGLDVNTVYTLKEKATLSGYKLYDKPIEFKIDENGKLLTSDGKAFISSRILVPNEKEKVTSIVTIHKTDGDEKALLGAEFALYKKENDSYIEIGRKKTQDDGVLSFDNLSGGTYKIVETAAPNGYVLRPFEQIFVVDDYKAKTFTYNVINPMIDIHARKITYLGKYLTMEKANLIVKDNPDAFVKQDGKSYSVYKCLSGAKIILRECGSSDVLQTFVSDSKGKIAIDTSKLDSSKNYELVEIEAPYGYKLAASPVSIHLKDLSLLSDFDGKLDIDFENKLLKGKVIVSKYDKTKGEKLPGVKFGLYDENHKLIQSLTTDKIGNAVFDDIRLGIYYVKEISTIPSYRFDSMERKIEITENNLVVNEVFYNEVQQMPTTGSSNLFNFAGVVVGLLIIYIVVSKKERIRKGEHHDEV